MSAFFAALLLAVCWPAAAFAPLRHARAPLRTGTRAVHSSAGAPRVPRRAILHLAPAAAALPAASWANSDKIVSKFATQAPPTDKDAEPFTYLESGVSYRCARRKDIVHTPHTHTHHRTFEPTHTTRSRNMRTRMSRFPGVV